MKQKIVYILRGIPGCGKSTFAASLCSENSIVVSADNFFIDNYSGEYKFDVRQIAAAHNACMNEFIKAIYKYDIDTIIVDNTNICYYEIINYYSLAKANGFSVNIHCFVAEKISDIKKCIERNTHNVPVETISSMALNHEYQKFKDIYSKEVFLLSIE